MKNPSNVSATDIYYRILQLGSERGEQGISRKDLIEILKEEKFIEQVEGIEHVDQWFDWSYSHKESGCLCPRDHENDPCGCNDDDPCNKFDHDNLCRRYLNKSALMDFSLLEQSHKSNEQIALLESQLEATNTSSANAQLESSKAVNLAICAILLSALMSIPDWIG